jgi:hypothetical protein
MNFFKSEYDRKEYIKNNDKFFNKISNIHFRSLILHVKVKFFIKTKIISLYDYIIYKFEE